MLPGFLVSLSPDTAAHQAKVEFAMSRYGAAAIVKKSLSVASSVISGISIV